MRKIKIEGGHKLTGEIEISGAKNSAVALVPAAILCDEEVKISNVPNISDIDSLEEILNYLNGKTSKVIVLGGDAASAATKYNLQAYYKSTGGGASLEYLSGEVLPALKIMED